MTLISTSHLVDSLRRQGLLDTAQQETLTALEKKCPDPRNLAKELIERGWLTAYQANQLLQGKGQDLVLGSYVLLERVGEGGMGQVFKARHRNLGRIVAVKLIRPERLSGEGAVRRFLREVRASAALVHPNIVLALDADDFAGNYLLVMEYLEGAIDLAQLVKKDGPLPVAQACDFIRQAALGLQHAHERGLVHRDIKPANLLLVGGGKSIKILDMGLARMEHFHEGSDSGTMTREGAVMGTPDYLSPEQAAESHTADIRADLYSLGCTLYYLLTGRVPFPGGSLMEKLLHHRFDDPVPIEKLRPDVPPTLSCVIRKLMAKKPAERFQTPAEVADALTIDPGLDTLPTRSAGEHTLADVARTEAPPATSDTLDSALSYMARAVDISGPRPSRGRRYGLAAGAGLVFVLCLYLLGGRDHPTPEPGKERPVATDKDRPLVPAKTPRPKKNYSLKEFANLLEGKWHYIGPFDNPVGMLGFDVTYPPEQEINLDAVYEGKNKQQVRWQEYPRFRVGSCLSFLRFITRPADREWACIYLYHEIDVPDATAINVSLGSDDALSVWLNGERLVRRKINRPLRPDGDLVSLELRPGKNRLLAKICNGTGEWGFYIAPIGYQRDLFYDLPGYPAWAKQVGALPAKKQVEAVAEKLKEMNPDFSGAVKETVEGGVVTGLELLTEAVEDLSPLRVLADLKRLVCSGGGTSNGKLGDLAALKGLRLTHLDCASNYRLSDLRPLRDMPLQELRCDGTAVADLLPLQGLPLKTLSCRFTPVADLVPLKGSGLKELYLDKSQVAHLGSLAGLPLEKFSCAATRVADLSSLRKMPLKELNCSGARVTSLEPLRGLPLETLHCTATLAWDLAPLAAVPLKQLTWTVRPERDGDLLRALTKLTSLNGLPPATFWPALAAKEKALEVWGQELVTLTADEQAKAVAAKLKEYNPTFDAVVTHGAQDNVVTSLRVPTDNVTDLTPLRVLPGLRTLVCGGSAPGTSSLLDLWPLKGMKLTTLHCGDAPVADLRPLAGMPLEDVVLDYPAPADAKVLRALPALARLNGEPAQALWDEADHPPPALDLLPLITPEKHKVKGGWYWSDKALVSAWTSVALLQIPYAPPEEYVLRLTANRKQGGAWLGIGLPVGKNQVMVAIDGYERRISGLDALDGKAGDANETTRKGDVFANSKPYEIVCRVRHQRIWVTVDGRTVIDWQGDPSRLSVRSAFAVPDKRALFLGASSVYHITRLELTPLVGEGQRLD